VTVRSGALDDPADRGGELRGAGPAALLQDMVEDDDVVVIGHLAFVAEKSRSLFGW
jgi:hypothetical protein